MTSHPGVGMSDMGTFRVTMEIENPLRRGDRRALADTLVDTGAELTWAPRSVLESLGITRQKQLGCGPHRRQMWRIMCHSARSRHGRSGR